MYQYDSSCQGSLDFEDFCVFIGDYLLTLNEARQKAIDYYEKMMKKRDLNERDSSDLENEDIEEEITLFFERFPELDDYLNALCLYNHDDILVDEIDNDEELIVNDPNVLKRKFQVRIYSAINIEQFFRIKYRENVGIEYGSLDPFVKVTLAGESKETTVLIGATKPLWNQDLIFSIIVPPGEIQDIQSWVETQSFYFELYDFNSHGIVSHTELLATGSIPLSQVLYSTKKTVMIDLLMHTSMDEFEISKPVYLEILLEDLTAEKWSWAKVRDKYTYPEEVWINKYLPKLKYDLENEVFERNNDNRKVVETKDDLEIESIELDTVFGYYQSVCSNLYSVFKNRMFSVIGLNENNNFVFLPCLLTPISYVYKTKEEIARFVSLIPSSTDILPISDESRNILSSFSAINISKLYYYIPNESSAIQFYSTSITPYNTDSFFRQFNSPNTILFKKRASLFEHCMILCDLFLGIGLDAYVAIGKLKHRQYMWVIVIDNSGGTSQSEVKLKLFLKNNKLYNVTKFANYNNLLEEYKYRCKVKVTHWNAMTGQSFVDGDENKFQCKNIVSLFNHKNIFFNIQRSENFSRSIFSWNLNDNTKWMPFLSQDNTFGEIKCSYHNRILYCKTFSSKSNIEEEYTLLSTLMKLIILYRRHFLFIVDTEFYRPLCKHFQEKLENIEKIIRSNNKDTKKEFAYNLFSNINEYLPSRHYFQGGLYCFKDNNPNLILEELISMGHISNSIPNSLFVISSKVFQYAEGVKVVWIIIGYIYDINIYELL
ncbi:hypothetical protein LY90DRAFT_667933 [Neocallimastix californiae]|jgi:hypothetical protein|uniref:C2 domain-containing protein n=1 Tax=Neocallimastix californiae TaxID=1754190 RepID=A0A1Y2E5H3_9FUNG|nr:hypothetical protein LY90DRAFT_667933 [Neocallimastix californiae]|eukprot:ORY66769.1 hypothetical protein LY90DRAFT_667933 [Neocallimastix californiae]